MGTMGFNKIKFRTGTKEQFNNLESKDSTTFYRVTDDEEVYYGDVRLDNKGLLPKLINYNDNKENLGYKDVLVLKKDIEDISSLLEGDCVFTDIQGDEWIIRLDFVPGNPNIKIVEIMPCLWDEEDDYPRADYVNGTSYIYCNDWLKYREYVNDLNGREVLPLLNWKDGKGWVLRRNGGQFLTAIKEEDLIGMLPAANLMTVDYAYYDEESDSDFWLRYNHKDGYEEVYDKLISDIFDLVSFGDILDNNIAWLWLYGRVGLGDVIGEMSNIINRLEKEKDDDDPILIFDYNKAGDGER